MVVMAVRGITAQQARATYLDIMPTLIALDILMPIGGGIVTAEMLNVRERPGITALVVGKLSRDDVVEIWGRTPSGDWLCIRQPCGWVAAEHVEQQ
jgi:hypothetical protein